MLLKPPLFSSDMLPAKSKVPSLVVEVSLWDRPPMTPSLTVCQRKESWPSNVAKGFSPSKEAVESRPVMAAVARIRRLYMGFWGEGQTRYSPLDRTLAQVMNRSQGILGCTRPGTFHPACAISYPNWPSARVSNGGSRGYRAGMESSSHPALSTRGAKLAAESPMADYIVEHFARVGEDQKGLTSRDGAQGYVPLCIAENSLLKHRVLERMDAVPLAPTRVLGYDAMVGAEPFREELSSFMERTFLGRRFAADQIAVLAGAGTVLEHVFYALGDPGDAVLVPTPSYAGFWTDLETRNDLRIIPVHGRSEEGFELRIERLEEALMAADRPVKALLFTNPDNPRGSVATAPANRGHTPLGRDPRNPCGL